MQKTTVDGEAINVHDISYPAFSGWRMVEHTFTARGPHCEICVFLEVVGPLEPWNWGYTSRTIVRRMTLEPVAPESHIT